MLETPAKLLSSIIIGLGTPEGLLLQESEAANVLFRRLAYYYEGIRQSDQNLLAEVTSEFTLAASANSKDLTTLTASDVIIPLWCERKIYDGINDIWEFVPTVNLDVLPEYRSKRRPAVAFYGATPNQVTAEFSYFGDESSTPTTTFRVWYAPANPITGNKDAVIAIPETLAPLLVVDSQLILIQLLCVNASKYLDKQPQLAPRIAAWQGMTETLREEKAEWVVRFNIWSKKSRGFHRARNHNEILDLYN